MTTSDNNSPLNITHKDVMRLIKRYIDARGLEYAIERFEELNALCSTFYGWAETADIVYAFFAEKRKEEQQRLREEKLEELRAAAPRMIMANKNEAKAVGKEEIDKMNVEVKSPGNNIARIIKLGEDNNDK